MSSSRADQACAAVAQALSRLLKNYLRCHCCVKNRLVRESDQNAHLQLVKSSATPTVFRLFLWGRHRYCIGCLAYVFQRPASGGS